MPHMNILTITAIFHFEENENLVIIEYTKPAFLFVEFYFGWCFL